MQHWTNRGAKGWEDSDHLWQSAAGMPVIIVCNGPSLATAQNLPLCGPGRLVLAVNNAYPMIRPDVWCGIDEPDCFNSALFHEPFPKIMNAAMAEKQVAGATLAKWCRNVHFADIDRLADVFATDRAAAFNDDENSFTFAVQLALWLGAREICLLGTDFSHQKGDYADGDYLTLSQRIKNSKLHAHLVRWLHEFSPRAAIAGVKIASCTAGSPINHFLPYREPGELLASLTAGIAGQRVKKHCLDGE